MLDSLTVLPATIISPDAPAMRLMYDMNTGKAYFYGDLPAQDSLTVCYQRLPANLTRWVGKRDMRLADTTDQYWKDVMKRYEIYAPPREQLVELKDFQKSGSFVRGLSLGNTQNVFVNSALNLQLEGKISEDLTFTAAISDQQIPYQPEGNTLQLQELDRVFMRLTHKHGNLTVGDIVLQNRDNYFLKFYKNTQGGFIETNYSIGKAHAQTFGGVAVAKGKFYSATLTPLEGVQGPYRLKGPNGELFIIIMANSEKVFIDGKPLQRGYNNDYVIDYNVGEIVFNSHILITRFTRLRVDYEYAERNYTRTIFTVGHEHKNTRSRFLTQLYREADNPNNPLISITDEAKVQLRNQTGGIGLVSGIDSVGYNPNEVLYRLTDSTDITGTYPSVLVYSNDTKKAVYRATFTYVGEKKGNYIRINSNLNGQVYQWVRPINGESQGDYEPLKTIPLPNKKQLWVNNFSYNLATHAQIIADVAISKQQNNAFSDISEATMTGLATRIAYLNTGKDIKDSTRYVPFGGISYEYNQASFTVIDRFRSIEFDRDWNKNIDSSRFDDHILQTEIGIKNKKNNLFSYKFLARQRAEQVNGSQQIGLVQYQFKKFQLKGNVFFLDSRQDSLRALWQRWQGEILYKGRYFTPSYRWNGDKNRVFLPTNDSVTNSLMYFEEHTFGLRSADSMRLKYAINYSIRADKIPFEGHIEPYLNANTWSFQTNFITKQNQNFLLTAIYRKAIAYNANAQGGENLQGRLDWNGVFKIGNMYKKSKIISNPIDTQAIKKSKIPIMTLRSELSLLHQRGRNYKKSIIFYW